VVVVGKKHETAIMVDTTVRVGRGGVGLYPYDRAYVKARGVKTKAIEVPSGPR